MFDYQDRYKMSKVKYSAFVNIFIRVIDQIMDHSAWYLQKMSYKKWACITPTQRDHSEIMIVGVQCQLSYYLTH